VAETEQKSMLAGTASLQTTLFKQPQRYHMR
jgi:hypothetical protein